MNALLDLRWRRLTLQLGLLGGIGLAFAISSHEAPVFAEGGQQCPEESPCGFKKVNFLFILDYSTSMNATWDEPRNLSAWDVATTTIAQMIEPGGYLSQNAHFALLRFGHDPDPGSQGTTIPGDGSGLVDGQALDVGWYDPDELGVPWFECNGQAIVDALAATAPPLGGAQAGIEPWTKGGLDFAATYIAATRANHPEDDNQATPPRRYVNVVLTQGRWTDADGTDEYAPAEQSPNISAAALVDDQEIRTLVFAVPSDAEAEAAADALAGAGGTWEAIPADTPEVFEQALWNIVQNNIGDLFPECVANLARVMILLDASSAMLNVDDGTQAGAMGETAWDQIREALVGRNSLFEVEIEPGLVVADLVHLGLAVYGDDEPLPGEHKLVAQYGRCMQDNFAWALAPEVSCVEPGCEDPWGGPPITWTFADGSLVPPNFDVQTISHMPRCEGADAHCEGSGGFVHLGLQFIAQNQAEYAIAGQQPNAPFPTHSGTPYYNILITDGRYDGYSTDAQVQAELEQMFASGMTTYVIGFGEGADTPQAQGQLQNMAQWGSGGQGNYYDTNSQAELAQALAQVVAAIDYDPCCAWPDCSENPEPTTNEPDPLPDSGEEGDGDGDPGDGDGDPGDGDTGDGDPSDGEGDEWTTDPSEDGNDGDSSGSDETDGGAGLIGRDGCNCTSTGTAPGAWMLALLSLLGLRRRAD